RGVDRGRRLTARAAPLVRHASARGRGGPEDDPGAARTLQPLDDAGLHPSRAILVAKPVRSQSSSGLRRCPDSGERPMEAEVKAFELKELWTRYKERGDDRARERLVVAYSPLVKFVAGRTGARLPSHVDQADLISYGMIGLIEAMERFDQD